MISFLFTILMFAVFGKLLGAAIRAAWGISKILVMLVFLPLILISLVICGLFYLVFPVLVILGIAMLMNCFD